MLHPESVHLSLQTSDGHIVGGSKRFHFDPCVSYPATFGPYQHPALPSYWSGFKFDPNGLPAGMLRMTASFDAGFVTTSDAHQFIVDTRRSPRQLTIFIAPPPDQEPQLDAGQRFIFLPPLRSDVGAIAFTNAAGDPVATSSMLARILILEHVDAARMQLRLEGTDFDVYVPKAPDAMSAPGLYPLVVDDSVKHLRAKYAGRQVWGYGGLYAYLSGGGTSGPLAVEGIYRAAGYGAVLGIGSPQYWSADLASDFVALDPLVIRFGTPAIYAKPGPAVPLEQVPASYAILSDVWDFERSYSLVSMTRMHPEWPAATLDAIGQHEVEMGMTKDMIAWMLGYPAAYGTKEQVQKLDVWTYEAPAPFGYTVYFRNGVVVKYDPPRTLP